MTNVPRVIPVRRLFGGNLPVTCSAQIIYLRPIQARGIRNRSLRTRVFFPRSMTAFAAHTRLEGDDCRSWRKFQRSSRVALKAPQYRGIWIERPVLHSRCRTMTGGRGHLLRPRIVSQSVFDIMFIVKTAYKRDCLVACAESPFSGLS